MNNPWDKLSSKFDTYKNDIEIDPGAADNILIVWPPVIDFIIKHFDGMQISGLKALDYGCGTGGFIQKLYSLGFNVLGVDSSEAMLSIARKSVSRDILFVNINQIPADTNCDLITGIMVFQFVKNIKKVLGQLVHCLNKNGLIVLVVFNPKFVSSCLKSQLLFSNFDSVEGPKKGIINFEDASIPIFIRNANEYDEIMNALGLTKRLELYPPFTKEYLSKYAINTPIDEPEYLILGYIRS